MNIFTWKTTLCTKLKEMLWRKQSNDTAINEVLFYGAEDEEARTQVGLNNLFCIYYVIMHASSSINICAPSLTSETITKSLISVRQKENIKIRIAIYNSVDYSSLGALSKHGIEVKVISSAVQLQHEFVLIDDTNSADAVAILGSLDYEVNRVNRNRDITLISSEPAVISSLKREFERVWNHSMPDIMKSFYDNTDASTNV